MATERAKQMDRGRISEICSCRVKRLSCSPRTWKMYIPHKHHEKIMWMTVIATGNLYCIHSVTLQRSPWIKIHLVEIAMEILRAKPNRITATVSTRFLHGLWWALLSAGTITLSNGRWSLSSGCPILMQPGGEASPAVICGHWLLIPWSETHTKNGLRPLYNMQKTKDRKKKTAAKGFYRFYGHYLHL